MYVSYLSHHSHKSPQSEHLQRNTNKVLRRRETDIKNVFHYVKYWKVKASH